MNADEWSEIHRCHRNGESIKGIAQRLGMSRNTVRRALAHEEPPQDHRRRVGTITDSVDADVRELLVENPDISIAEVGRRVGWERSRTMLARKVNEVRSEVESARKQSERVAAGIPSPATSFVGRRAELREVRRLLGDHRLVSVVGPGGIGKTRLAVQAAYDFRRAFPDGVRFVEFASVRTPDLLAQVVCDGLALENRDSHDRSPEETLVDYLEHRRMLLVLDNCEHVVDAAAELVARLLEHTSALRIIATTREFLSVPGEYVFAMPSLPTRDETGSGAADLFAQRAAAVLSGFELTDANSAAIERICERLDGLPLAIELACARLTVLSIDDLSDLLDQRLSVLTGSARVRSPRQRSLHATVEWSYELCSVDERTLWTRLSVFADGFTLPMAIAVCADEDLAAESIMDSLAALVAKSVVQRGDSDEHARFRMLESIREYGSSKLTLDQQRGLQSQLLRWCADLIRTTASGWYGPDQFRYARAVRDNRGNIRAALDAAMSEPHRDTDAHLAAEALGSAMFLWSCGISVREHRMWLTRALELPAILGETKRQILGVLALIQILQGDRESADFALQRIRAIAREDGDAGAAAFVAHLSGLRHMFSGDLAAARTEMDEAANRYRIGGAGADLVATLRIHQGMLLSAAFEVGAAEEHFTAVHAQSSAVGELWFRSFAAYGLGLVALLQKDFVRARDLAMEGLSIQRSFGDVVGTTLMTDLLGWALAELDSATRAAVLLGAASSMWGSFGQQLYGSEHWIALRSKAVDTARARIGGTAFDRSWEKGRSMSAAELFDYIFTGPKSDRASGDERHGFTGAEHHADEILTPREREVADLVVAGLTNKQIAEKLVLSTRTVEGHVEHVLRKLGVQRRVELVAAAIHGGTVPSGSEKHPGRHRV
ncbi:LuxR C-terminal-related transcriptional regulator [Aldersonia kunmingensis]|uniref:LuxR C-terminal-related transcriptional regulator n=1 Tax=Aldersonia kunmingensis TaxID=408066 RepID=UPI000837A57B|nr:LuxR C-terminal-related transcriptional regulator [Aldersonia kunmingensis]